jgi:uncharacterized protein
MTAAAGKLICPMATIEQIEQFGRDIGREFHPERVILFGSHARGTPTSDSDVDLLVILPHVDKPMHKSVEIRLKLRPPFPVDLLVRTPEKVRERLDMGDDFMREILEKGKVLYEADTGNCVGAQTAGAKQRHETT